MEFVEPKVELVAYTQLDDGAVSRYLTDIGAEDFEFGDIEDAEKLIVLGGKLCYKSFKPGLNPNVTKVRSDSVKYIENIDKVGHGSVVEHPNVSFLLWNVSRVATHELVRHRAGTAFSQESLRYVRLDRLKVWMPEILEKYDAEGEVAKLFESTVKHLEGVQQKLAELCKIDEIEDFGDKKKLTSAFRRLAPMGTATAILFTMNLRAASHIIQLRTSRHSEEEIRLIFDLIAKRLKEKFPVKFSSLHPREIDGCNEWVTDYASTPYDGEEIAVLRKRVKELEEKYEKDS